MEIDFPLSNQISYKQSYFNDEHRRKIVHQIVFNAISKEQQLLIVGDEGSLKKEFPEFWDTSNSMDESWIDTFQDLNQLSSTILACANRLQKPIFGNLSLLELSEIAEASNLKKTHEFLSSTIEDSDFEFTKKEFWNLRGKLEKAASIYSEEIDYLDRNSIVDDNVFVDNEEDTRQITRKYIARFLSSTEELLADFASFFVQFKREQELGYSKVIDRVDRQINALENKWEYYNIDINTETFQSIIDGLKSIDIHTSVSKKDLKKAQGFQQLKKALQNAKSNKEAFVKEKTKAINIKSYRSETLDVLDERLEILVKEINGSSFLKERLELNAISTWIRFKHLQDIYKKLNTCREIMKQDHRFFEWKSCLNDSGATMKLVLEQLRMYPKDDWMLLYESWYLNKVISRSDYEKHSFIFDQLQVFDETYDSMSSDFLAVVNVIKKHSNIKSKSKQTAFDFNVVSVNDLEKALESEDRSCVVVLDLVNQVNFTQIELLEKLYSNQKNVHYIAGQPTLKWEEGIRVNRFQIEKSLSIADIEVKLDYAKALASQLTSQAGHIKFLFTRTKNIIVNAFTFKAEDIVQALKDSNIKQMHVGEHVHRSITEFFLNECEAGFYIYDQSAFDFQSVSEIHDHIEWIRALQQAGYFTIYIDNTRIDEEGYIDSLVPKQQIYEG